MSRQQRYLMNGVSLLICGLLTSGVILSGCGNRMSQDYELSKHNPTIKRETKQQLEDNPALALASTYPPVFVSSFYNGCMRQFEDRAKSIEAARQSNQLLTQGREYCACTIQDLQTRIPYEDFIVISTKAQTDPQAREQLAQTLAPSMQACSQ